MVEADVHGSFNALKKSFNALKENHSVLSKKSFNTLTKNASTCTIPMGLIRIINSMAVNPIAIWH